MPTATISLDFMPPTYEGADEDINAVTAEIFNTIDRHFLTYAQAEAALKEHSDIAAGFVWDFPTDTHEQRAARALALDCVIEQSPKAKAWAAFMDDAQACAAAEFYGREMGDPQEGFRFSVKFNSHVDAGPGPRVEELRGFSVRASGAGGHEDYSILQAHYGAKADPAADDLPPHVAAFRDALHDFRAAKRADDSAYLNHNAQIPHSVQSLRDAGNALREAETHLRKAAGLVSEAEADGIGAGAAWRNALGYAPARWEVEESHSKRDRPQALPGVPVW